MIAHTLCDICCFRNNLKTCNVFEHLDYRRAHNLLLALFCLPFRSCVTGLLFSSDMAGTSTVSASCCCWLRPLLLLLYNELLSLSLTAFPIVLPRRRLVKRIIPPELPALPFAFLWGLIIESDTGWKLKNSLSS
jgi:hypothetical protein